MAPTLSKITKAACKTNPTALRQPCEVYSRVVGYIRPVQNWNPGKVEEFQDRITYDKVLELAS